MVPGNRVTLVHDAEHCLPAMERAIAAAEREILLEMYWFDSDATGRRFAALLADKARAGVRVCVTYDSVGSWGVDRSMFDAMRAAGCEIYEYNPLRGPWLKWRISNRRNHRKQLIIDGRLGMTGGVNLADAWSAAADGGTTFRDDVVVIEGPAVAVMREIFAATFVKGPGMRAIPSLPLAPACGDSPVSVLANDERKNRRLIERAYVRAIQSASRRVLIENSYFIPGFLVRRALTRAKKRGVDVRVLLPLDSDVPVVSYATHKLYAPLLRHGIRIFEWGRSILHSKTAVIDDFCTLGTHNLDYRSWLYNLEINVSIADPAVAAQLALRIERDMAESVEIDARSWSYRPLWDRVLEEFFYRFRRIL